MLQSGFLGMRDRERPTDEEIAGPLYVIVLGSCACLLISCILGYVINLCRGARGTDAIPYYNWVASTMSISDYQLKPNPRPEGM